MKTSEERVEFKTHFFQLGQGRIIPLSDTKYWNKFWVQPNHINDIFELLTASDIQQIRDQNRSNFFLLIYILCQKLINSSELTSPDPYILNYCRFLTKLLPFLFEIDDYSSIESKLFLASVYEPLDFVDGVVSPLKRVNHGPVLADKLIKAIVKLLFFKGFTMSRTTKVNSLWEPGVGTKAKYGTVDVIIELNRTTLLRLLLTLCGSSLYHYPSQTVGTGSIFLTILVSCLPKMEILALVCSLINVSCRSLRLTPQENMLQLNDVNLKFSRYLYCTCCIQLLTLMVIYPLPSKSNLLHLIDVIGPKPYNLARLYFGRLHKDQEVMFLSSCLLQYLKTPLIDSDSSMNLNLNRFASSPPIWTMEVMMLLWELLQCNNTFKQLCGPKFYAELCFVISFYIKTYCFSIRDQPMLRLASCFLLYLSHQKPYHDTLLDIDPDYLKNYPGQLNFNHNQQISTRDFIIIQICLVLSNYASNKHFHSVNSFFATTLVEILYNLMPLLSSNDFNGSNDSSKKLNNSNFKCGLSYSAATSVTNLIVRFSNRDFLLRAPFNPDLLALIIRSVCITCLRNTKSSRMLLFSILKSEKIYDQTFTTIDGFKSEYFDDNKLMLKTVEDEPEPSTDVTSEINSATSTIEGTPLNRSTSNLTINDDDPRLPPIDRNSQFSYYGDGQDISVEGLDGQYTDEFEEEVKAIDKALRPSPPTGMTPKAIGKQRKQATLNKTWAGSNALKIILVVVIPHLKLALNEILSTNPGVDAFTLVQCIGRLDFSSVIKENRKLISHDFLPTTPLSPLTFSWSAVSLGWYISLPWSDIYNSLEIVENATGGKNKIMQNIKSSVMSLGRFFQPEDEDFNKVVETPLAINEVEKSTTKVNHWAHTSIKMFKIKTGSSFLDVINSKIIGMQAQTQGTTPDRPASLSRRLSDLRLQQVRSSTPVSGLNTPKEEVEATFLPRATRHNSISSFQSLNSINRSRTNTPRNSISN